MSMIEGRLHWLCRTKVCDGLFASHEGYELSPSRNQEHRVPVSDLESIWGFTPSKANAAIAQLGGMDTSTLSHVDEQRSTNCFL